MRSISERIEEIKAELTDIKVNLMQIEDKVEEGLELIADEAALDAKISNEVRRIIEDTHELNPIFISVLDGASYFSGKVSAELRKHNEQMLKNRCGLLKLSPSEKKLGYNDFCDLKTTTHCVVSYNTELYFADAYNVNKLEIDQLGASLFAMLQEKFFTMACDTCVKANKATHNAIAFKMPELNPDTFIQYEHTAMRTRSYEGVEQKTMQIDSLPKGELGGEYVIVLDDVADRGETAKAIKHYLKSVGVKDDVLFVLVDKITAGRECNPTYKCIDTSPTAFLVGGGMDLYTGRFRENPSIWAVNPDTLPEKANINNLLGRRKRLNSELRDCIQQEKIMTASRASSPTTLGGIFSSRNSQKDVMKDTSQVVDAMGVGI